MGQKAPQPPPRPAPRPDDGQRGVTQRPSPGIRKPPPPPPPPPPPRE